MQAKEFPIEMLCHRAEFDRVSDGLGRSLPHAVIRSDPDRLEMEIRIGDELRAGRRDILAMELSRVPGLAGRIHAAVEARGGAIATRDRLLITLVSTPRPQPGMRHPGRDSAQLKQLLMRAGFTELR